MERVKIRVGRLKITIELQRQSGPFNGEEGKEEGMSHRVIWILT